MEQSGYGKGQSVILYKHIRCSNMYTHHISAKCQSQGAWLSITLNKCKAIGYSLWHNTILVTTLCNRSLHSIARNK